MSTKSFWNARSSADRIEVGRPSPCLGRARTCRSRGRDARPRRPSGRRGSRSRPGCRAGTRSPGFASSNSAPAVGRLGVLTGLVQRRYRSPHLQGVAFDRRRQSHPWMPPGSRTPIRSAAGKTGRRMSRPRRRSGQAHGFRVEDLRAAVRARNGRHAPSCQPHRRFASSR